MGSQLSQILLLLRNAAGNRFGRMQIVQANKDEFSWDLCKREMSFFFLNVSQRGTVPMHRVQCSGVFCGEKTPGKEDLSVSCGRQGVGSTLSLPGAVQRDAIPCGAVRPSQGIAGFQLLLPVISNSPKSPARLILVTLHLREEREPSQRRSIPGFVGMDE